MNYFFVYRLSDGTFYGSPYFGGADEWTNVPEGCGVVGPLQNVDGTATDAFQNPDCYTVVNGKLTPLPNISDIKTKKEVEQQRQNSMPTVEQQMNLSIIEIWENIIPLLPQ